MLSFSLLVPLVSFGLATAASGTLLVLIAANWRKRAQNAWVAAGCLACAVWAGATLAYWIAAQPPSWTGAAAGFARLGGSAAFVMFLVRILRCQGEEDARIFRPLTVLLPIALALFIGGIALLDLAALVAPGYPPEGVRLTAQVLGTILVSLFGLMLIENILRNGTSQFRWAFKFLAIGTGITFAYDLCLGSEALLFSRINEVLMLARGVVSATGIVFIAIGLARNGDWAPRIHVSRQVVLHGTTSLAGGVYMLVMAAAGYHARLIGGDWGEFFQAVVLFGAVTILMVVLASGGVRAHVRQFIERHFYSHRYDYRLEWPKFIDALSADGSVDLGERAVRAICDIVEVPEGVLWLRAGERYEPTAYWNTSSWALRSAKLSVAATDPFALALRTGEIIEIGTGAPPARTRRPVELPAWLVQQSRAWLVVPLLHRDALLGFVVLGRARAPHRLRLEERDILKLAARQAASYLAERAAFQELMEARQFTAFSRRITFIAHDVKNLGSRLELSVANAKRHRTRPEFIDDLIETVRESAEAMRQLLTELGSGMRAEEGEPQVLATGPLVGDIVRRYAGRSPCPRLDRNDPLEILADRRRFSAVLHNLIQNASEAAGPNGNVSVRVLGLGGEAVIEVEDDGPGMDGAFIGSTLFRPFRSTKDDGYGIGAFECREFAQKVGGRIEVDSAPGQGTTIRLILPQLCRARIAEDRVITT